MTIKDNETIKLGNALTAATVDDLRIKLLEVFNQNGKEVVLDLGKVDTVDAVGVGLILATHNTLKNLGGNLELINVSKDVYDLVHTMRLNQYFEIRGS